MSFDLDAFMVAHRDASDQALLLACLGEMEGGTVGQSSLEIHAALEVMARYSLLPLVDGARRAGARRQMARAAWDFAAVAVPPAADVGTQQDGGSLDALAVAPWHAVGRRMDEAIRQPCVLRALAPRVVQEVGGAGHGQILLRHVLDADPHVRRKLLPHLQMFVRAFGEDADTAHGAVIPQLRPLLSASAGALDEFLGGIPRSGVATPHTGIRGVMAHGQGVAVADVGGSAGSAPGELAGMACIAAARMMLTAQTELEYGWSHCLTLPEAAWTFVDRGDVDGELGALVALSYVVGFIAALGFPGWPAPPPPGSTPATEIDAFRQALASATPADAAQLCLGASAPFARQAWGEVVSMASGMEDAHLVKYVHSCLRSAARKPEAEPIFLAAATRLLARWLVR